MLLENYAIMNYCGFSKILKKHDKLTGYTTREAYLKNVLSKQNFTHFPFVMELLRMVERLFEDVQSMHNAMPIQAEEKLFIDAIRGLNYQAQKLQAEEISNFGPAVDQAEAQVVEAIGDEPSDQSESNGNSNRNKINMVIDVPTANTNANVEGADDLAINSSLFPRTNSSDKEKDSFFSSEDGLQPERKRFKTADESDLDKATIAVLHAADRVKNLAPSPNLKYTMNWMTAVQSSTRNVDPVDKTIGSIVVSDNESREKR